MREARATGRRKLRRAYFGNGVFGASRGEQAFVTKCRRVEVSTPQPVAVAHRTNALFPAKSQRALGTKQSVGLRCQAVNLGLSERDGKVRIFRHFSDGQKRFLAITSLYPVIRWRQK